MEFFKRLFDTDFMPHGHCYFWKPGVLWTNVIGDGVIALSYFVIPFLLLRFLEKRKDIEFRHLFVAFAAFILACGTTHVLDVVSVWHPMYRLEGLVKLITAIISGGTVMALFYYFPAIVSIPTAEQWTKAKAAAEISDRRFKLLIEQAPVGVAITNVKGEFTEVNEAMCHLFKYGMDEFRKMNFMDVTHPDDIGLSISAKDALADGKAPSMQFEKRYLRKDGSYFWAMISATAIPEEQCNLVHIMDITSRKESELRIQGDNLKLEGKVKERTIELQETNKDLENFIYAVTHDLRVPLHNLQGLSAVVEEELAGVQGKEEAIAALQMIGENARKMDDLVTDLLAFSKTGKLEFVKKEFDIEAAMATTFDEQKSRYNDRPIEFTLGKLPLAFGDQAALQQVCQNLIGNALKYASRREAIHIEVTGWEENGMAIFRVADNGIGFDTQYSNKLFLPFQRLHYTEEFEGTGIGLATSHRIVQKHSGEMWAESKLGEGATFYFSLPTKAINNDNHPNTRQ
jgi:PAS domain S-box-containing protein